MLAGKYRIERIIGRGGMGVVLAARHVQLEQQVALKFMTGEMADEEAKNRFLREAQAAVRLRGEHVARVWDVGTLEDGAQYIVMEYLEGRDLSAILTERRVFAPSEAVDYVLQACVAMAEAHARGIIHRDLKPGNLFLTTRPDGTPLIKVLDFGVSKMTKSGIPASATTTAAFMGSPAYMSPEQMKSAKHVGPQADIWSLGAILYELMSGELPFAAESVPEICAKVIGEPPDPLRVHAPNVPTSLEDVILHCLAKDPQNRYGNVGELASALLPYASLTGRRHVESITEMLRSGLGIDSLTHPPEAQSTIRNRGTRSKIIVGGAIIAAGAASAVGVAMLARGTQPRRPDILSPTDGARGEGNAPIPVVTPLPDAGPIRVVALPPDAAPAVVPSGPIPRRPPMVGNDVHAKSPASRDSGKEGKDPGKEKDKDAGPKEQRHPVVPTPPEDPFGHIQ